MHVDVVTLRQRADRALAQKLAHRLRAALRELVDERRHDRALPSHDRMGDPAGQQTHEDLGNGVDPWQRDHVTRGALQHGHVRGAVGHARHQRDGRRPATDDDDLLARPVQVLRPALRVEKRPPEMILARKVGTVTLVVAVVAAANGKPRAGEGDPLAGRDDLGGDGPAGGLAVPVGVDDPMPETDQLIHPALAGCGADVLADRRAVGDGTRFGPGPERVAEREHVRVRAHTGIAEKVPGAADRVAGFEDGDRVPRPFLREPAGSADTGQPGPHDQDVDVLERCRHGGRLALIGPARRPTATAGVGAAGSVRRPLRSRGCRYRERPSSRRARVRRTPPAGPG